MEEQFESLNWLAYKGSYFLRLIVWNTNLHRKTQSGVALIFSFRQWVSNVLGSFRTVKVLLVFRYFVFHLCLSLAVCFRYIESFLSFYLLGSFLFDCFVLRALSRLVFLCVSPPPSNFSSQKQSKNTRKLHSPLEFVSWNF